MDAEQAKKCVVSGTVKERLKAARFFSANPTLISTDALREALLQEGVPWIRKALSLALERADVSVVRQINPKETADGEVNGRLVRSIMARATEEVTGTILHEFGTLIGEIHIKAMSEFDGFADSQTFKLISRLKEILKAVRQLKRASASPSYTEFNIGELVDEIIQESQSMIDGIKIIEAGQRPFMVTADRGSMFLAMVNGLRNASEAVRGFSKKDPPEIVLTWGRAGDEVFFAIMDSGSGFKGNPSDALRIGVSSKENHTGYGLATASSAMKAMEGDLQLSNSLDGGARFELRWYRDNENTLG